MSYKPYAKYKPSGVEWIGEIPEGWRALAIKRLSPVKRGASPRPIDDPKYFDDCGEFAWVRIADVSASERYLEKTTQQLSELGSSLSVKRQPGDIFLSIAGTVGKPIISKIKCCIHDGFVYFPDLDVNPEYLYYLFTTGLLFKGLGKWGTQLNLNTETVGDIAIPMPSPKEIDNIVAFLDRKTAQIDKLIEIKRKQIELLKEERTAIINQAVTKGLNPDAKMKESGIEWIGETPEGWAVISLKRIASVKYGLGQPPKLKEDGLPLIRATNVERGKINPHKLLYVDPNDVPYERDPVLRTDDIVVVRSGAYTGDSAIIPEEYDGSITGYDMVVRVEEANPMYIAYSLLSSHVLNNQIDLIKLRAAQPHLNAEELGDCLIVLPPLSEQVSLTELLDQRTSQIRTTISKAEQQIKLLQEYRTTLISDAVTGKIDIREEAA